MKATYSTKEELVKDIIKGQTDMPDGLVFSGINKYNQVLFDLKVDVKNSRVSDLTAHTSKANFIDRYYQSLSHLVEK
jgi:hypothetical protein